MELRRIKDDGKFYPFEIHSNTMTSFTRLSGFGADKWKVLFDCKHVFQARFLLFISIIFVISLFLLLWSKSLRSSLKYITPKTFPYNYASVEHIEIFYYCFLELSVPDKGAISVSSLNIFWYWQLCDLIMLINKNHFHQ